MPGCASGRTASDAGRRDESDGLVAGSAASLLMAEYGEHPRAFSMEHVRFEHGRGVAEASSCQC